MTFVIEIDRGKVEVVARWVVSVETYSELGDKIGQMLDRTEGDCWGITVHAAGSL